MPIRSPLLCLGLALALAGCAANRPAEPPAPAAEAGPTPPLFDSPELVQRYQQTITPEDLAAHLYLFASDYFEGRETTARGQRLAAHYLAAQYRKMGLAPKGTMPAASPYDPQAYFQPIPLFRQRLREARLTVSVAGRPVATQLYGPDRQDDDAYLALGAAGQASGGVVFAGYGIAAPELGYDDLAALKAKNVDLSGQWLLVLRDEPLASDSASLLRTADGRPSEWSRSLYQKVRAAAPAGPAGLLVVADAGPRGVDVAAEAERLGRALREDVGSLSLREGGRGRRSFPPVFHVSSALADQILKPAGRTVAELKSEIDRSLKPVGFAVPGAHVASHVEHESQQVQSENVVAFLEGSDPALRDEVLIVSSHYDHVGVDPTLEGDQIFNGADDDGSGTVAILEIAEAFRRAAADGHGPRRSVLFLNVTGEEKGLLGSEYYADVEPVVPLERTVANLNIDMIGRFDPTHPTGSRNYVYIIGSNLISQELHDINARANTLTGIDIELDERFNSKEDPNQFYRRSDHWNFGKHSIPFIFYFTGTHEDYHGTGDEPHKIDYDRMARVARLIFATAWQVANQDQRPAISGQGFN